MPATKKDVFNIAMPGSFQYPSPDRPPATLTPSIPHAVPRQLSVSFSGSISLQQLFGQADIEKMLSFSILQRIDIPATWKPSYCQCCCNALSVSSHGSIPLQPRPSQKRTPPGSHKNSATDPLTTFSERQISSQSPRSL
jgi:hypothetical protein